MLHTGHIGPETAGGCPAGPDRVVPTLNDSSRGGVPRSSGGLDEAQIVYA